METKCGIYLITVTRPDNLPLYYVGQSSNTSRRKQEHLGELRRGTHPNGFVQNVFNKYGKGAFAFSILEECHGSELNDFEQFWLDEMVGGERCLNISFNAESFSLGLKQSEEAKRKISIANTGKRHSEKTRRLISDIQKGQKRSPRSEETKRKIGDAQLGEQNHAFGKRGKNHVRSRPVEGVSVKTGERVMFESIHLAHVAGFNLSGIHQCFTGKLRQYKGFVWKRLDETPEPMPTLQMPLL